MEIIKNILINYWDKILAAVFFIVSFILLCVKKRPVSDILSFLYSWCILGIRQAEATDLKGQDKLDYALDYVLTCFASKYGSDAKLPCSIAYVEFLIESILSTPQKKGGNSDGEKKTNG